MMMMRLSSGESQHDDEKIVESGGEQKPAETINPEQPTRLFNKKEEIIFSRVEEIWKNILQRSSYINFIILI